MKKETAIAAVRLFPSTRRKLKIGAAKKGQSLAAFVENLVAAKPPTPLQDK